VNLENLEYYVFNKFPQSNKIISGVLAFDIVTGGGIPKGEFILFHGDKFTGKSAMALRLINNFLKADERHAVYLSFGEQINPFWLDLFPPPNDRLLISEPDAAPEDLIDVIISLYENPHEVGMIVIDNLKILVSNKESRSKPFSINIVSSSLLWNMFRELFSYKLHCNENARLATVLFITNQISMKADKLRDFDHTLEPFDKIQDDLISMYIEFKIKKMRRFWGPPKITYQVTVNNTNLNSYSPKTAQFDMYLDSHKYFSIGEYDEAHTYIEYMKNLNILVKEGEKWQIYDREFKNLKEVAKFLKTEIEAKQTIHNQIINLLFNNERC